MNRWGTSLIIVAGILCAAYIVSRFFLSLRVEHDIEVKGYAELPVKSDRGNFSISASARGATVLEAQTKLNAMMGKINDYISDYKPANSTLTKTISSIGSIYKKTATGNDTNEIEFYTAASSQTVSSTDVDGIGKMAENAKLLLDQGLEITFSGPFYFITDTEKYKMELIKRATESGRQRAELLVKTAGGKLGMLTSAHQGVIEIKAPDDSDNGDHNC